MPHRIRIRHPGYHGQNTLFTLPAREGERRDHVHYATVVAACSIITNNEDEIWLSRSSDGAVREVPVDDLIPAGDFFLHIRPTTALDKTPFAIVPNFRSWEFPHGSLPQLWQDASLHVTNVADISNVNLDLIPSESCRITANRLACEDAHIIPSSEKLWFTSNEMDEYGQISGRSGDTVADTWVNKMRLQAQAHRLWDDLQFAIVPRRINAESAQANWFTQMMNENDELERDWHYKPLQPLAGRACQFLYARFAYGIFPRLHAFLQGGQPRWLIVRLPDGTSTAHMYSASDCRDFTVGQGKGRSVSPSKRARSTVEDPVDSFLTECCEDQEWGLQCSEPLKGATCSVTSESADSGIAGPVMNNDTKWNASDRLQQCQRDCGIRALDLEGDRERGRKRFKT